MPDVDRGRAARLLAEAGLDALVAAKPETFTYLTGAPPGVAALFRRAGAALAILPADPALPPAAIVTDLFAGAVRRASGLDDIRTHADWVETADIRPYLPSDLAAADLVARAHAERPEGFARPTTFEAAEAFRRLGEVLAERGLAAGRIGLDLDFWPVADFRQLTDVLSDVRFVDASATIDRLKAVKSPREIERLEIGARLAEAGVAAVLPSVLPGASRAGIAAGWSAGVDAEVARLGAAAPGGRWEYVAFGPDPWRSAGTVAAGDVVKFDVGCVVDGYSSDCARTFVVGDARPRTREIHAILIAAFEAGLALLRPGRRLCDVHAAATDAIRRSGLARFSRGHFGHGLGADTFGEVWPFIAADARIEIEPDMVLAYEIPFYVDGEGGFIIEDQFRITADGAEPAWRLSRDLVSIG